MTQDHPVEHAAEPMPVEDALRAAVDDLWGCIGHEEIKHLQPETVAIAKANHEGLWHADEEWADLTEDQDGT